MYNHTAYDVAVIQRVPVLSLSEYTGPNLYCYGMVTELFSLQHYGMFGPW